MLERALASIREAHFDDLELLIVSDDEDRETFMTAQTYLTQKDTFVKRAGRPGPAESRNIGIGLARGRYLLFLDDDDTFRPCLPDQLAAQELNGDNVIFWDYELVSLARTDQGECKETREIRRIGEVNLDILYARNFIPNNCVAVPRLLALGSQFDPALRSHEDWDFLLNLRSAGTRFLHMPFIGSAVYQHSPSGQRNSATLAAGEWVPNFLHIYRKWPADENLKALRHARLAQLGLRVPMEWL
jgi:glycosyltransferase involved in cell wall biosynthesis